MVYLHNYVLSCISQKTFKHSLITKKTFLVGLLLVTVYKVQCDRKLNDKTLD